MSNFPDVEKKLQKHIDYFKEELGKVRTGRANPAIVENIPVEQYGSKQPLKALGSISTLDAQTLVVEPWNKDTLEEIAAAISKSQAGVQAVVEGERIRIPFPSLSQERREEFVRHINKKAEEVKAQMRQLRDEEIKELKQQEKDSEIGEDMFHRTKEKLEKVFKDYFEKVDNMREKKEEELSAV